MAGTDKTTELLWLPLGNFFINIWSHWSEVRIIAQKSHPTKRLCVNLLLYFVRGTMRSFRCGWSSRGRSSAGRRWAAPEARTPSTAAGWSRGAGDSRRAVPTSHRSPACRSRRSSWHPGTALPRASRFPRHRPLKKLIANKFLNECQKLLKMDSIQEVIQKYLTLKSLNTSLILILFSFRNLIELMTDEIILTFSTHCMADLCFTWFDSTKLVNLLIIITLHSCWIQTSQTRAQL